MSRARRRVARGLGTLRGVPVGRGTAAWESVRIEAELAEVGRWLEEFHPYSLVELDYGGLVHLASDDGLRGDQSVAEIRAALDGLAKGERELAIAMYKRARDRWRAFAEFEQAN
jgi:glycine cleavage system aminomethyltransferase T